MVNSAYIKWTDYRAPVLKSTILQHDMNGNFQVAALALTHNSLLQPLRVRRFHPEQPIRGPSLS